MSEPDPIEPGTARLSMRTRFTILITAIVAVVEAVTFLAVIPSTTALLIAFPISLAAVAVATWWGAGLVLRPIEEVSDIASRLAPDSIPADVDLAPTSPEVERLETELAAAMARIDAGYEAQRRFVSNLAHELKTPISVILAQAQTLSTDSTTPAATREFVASTIEEMQRLGGLIESFLMLTRARDGTGRELAPLPLNEIVMESVEHCREMAGTHDVELGPALIEADALVAGDPELLRTAIENLVRNAICFSRKGDRVTITVRDDGATWAVDVRDHGPGIPAEVIDRIFDRYDRSEADAIGGGSGLGLQIAQGIVELHGGAITVANEPPGCRFAIRLPKAGAPGRN